MNNNRKFAAALVVLSAIIAASFAWAQRGEMREQAAAQDSPFQIDATVIVTGNDGSDGGPGQNGGPGGSAIAGATSADASNLAQLIPPDVILLDNNLPDGYGLDYIGLFRAMLPKAQIIMISAMDIHNEAFAAGADNFFSKPIDTQRLISL